MFTGSFEVAEFKLEQLSLLAAASCRGGCTAEAAHLACALGLEIQAMLPGQSAAEFSGESAGESSAA
ncbi:MAG: hypothetical protein ACFCVE_06170 [Phycisphaerae bacterium]